MTNPAPRFAPNDGAAIPIHVMEADALADWLENADTRVRVWVAASEFKAALGQVLLVPDQNGGIEFVLAGWGDKRTRARGRFHMAIVARKLPQGIYEIVSGLDENEHTESALAWLLSAYAFDRYTSKKGAVALLRPDNSVDQERLLAQAAGDFLTRDLINTPTNDMGPDALEDAFLGLAKSHGADTNVIKGDDLIAQNFPMIHAVGRASDQAPRLLDMTWGDPDHPKITLVGKGVCFDTGGLNIKPGASMGLMKKDMGGSATVMGLAHMIMAMKLPVRLRVLVPAVENSISAGAYRPQDILMSRKGKTVEINNTDAEGRLVLADALTLADEESPDLLICTATLTGAARVALGPDVPPFFTNHKKLAKQISKSAKRVRDPLWRMPFWDPYEPMIEPDVADLDNAPKGGFGGAITAALFLRRFVENTDAFVHLDVYGWTPSAKPARSKGGACQSARAMFDVIAKRYG